jgi:pimeloyl-ACP methyl ester carboxylesterase
VNSVTQRILQLFGSVLLLFVSVLSAATPDTVILLHGLGRTSASMSRLASALEREGYRVVNTSYPSRGQPIESLATEWLPAQLRSIPLAAAEEAANPKIHFVTHSMGGIILRLWLRERGVPSNLGRVVMLAPPNAGSELTDQLMSFAPYRWFTGANGQRLGTGPTDLPRSLGAWPAVTSDLGIIAGNSPINPFTASRLPGPSDGKVTVATTHLAGERDHLVVPYSHTWLGYRSETIAQVIAFLREGKFKPRQGLISNPR